MSAVGTVLCIAGSPRRRGNTDRLLEEFARGVEGAGGAVRTLVASDAGIGACTGCHACSKTGRCVIADGMSELYAAIDDAAAIAVFTPVYFATVPSGLKALYDRCQPYWARRYVQGLPRVPRRPGALVVVGGGGDPFGTDCAVTTTRSVMNVVGISLDDVYEVIGPDASGDVADRLDALERCRDMGSRTVERIETAIG